MAPMTGEQIYHNFKYGNPDPLQNAADKVDRLADSYQAIAQKFEDAQTRMTQSWTGGASAAAEHGAGPLAPAMRLSAEHLSGYASAHGQQSQAFRTAQLTVEPVPPMPAALDPLEMMKIGVTGGPFAQLEAFKSHQDAVAAHNAAAEHNVRVMDGYQGATDVNRQIPENYPWPKYGGSTFSTEDDGGEKPGGDGGGDSKENGGGEKLGSGGGELGGPGGGLPNGAVEPSSVGTLPPTKDMDDTWPNRRLDPPATPPPPTDPLITPPPNRGAKDQDKDKDDDGETGGPEEEEPEGPEPPDWSGPDLGEDDVDDTTAASSSSGDRSASRDSGNWGPVGGSWGAGDRAGGDASRAGGGTAFGPGGPGGEFGAGRGAGAAAGAGFRSGTAGGRGGAGGFGGAVPQRGRGEEDDEHNRPEYLVEPDPNSLFGTDEQASSPVIGAAWKPE